MRNGCGLETEPRGGTIMRSNNRIICSIVCNPNCAVQYSTVQYSQVSIVGVIRLSKEFKVVTTNWLNDFPPNCWINYILNKYQISILKYHSVTFKDSIRYSSKDFGSIKERFSFLIFHLDRLAGNATRRHHWIWRSIFCLFQNKIPRILINRETSRPVTLRWGIE